MVMNFFIPTDIKQNVKQQLLMLDTAKLASPDNGIFFFKKTFKRAG